MNTTAARTLISILALALVAIPFWLFAVAPKRERSNDLSAQVDKLRSSLAEMTQAADEAAAARKGFTGDYRQFVLLGKAVPADDETASLLVELNHVADASGVEFRDLELDNSTQAGAPPPAAAPSVPAAAQPTATEPAPAAGGSGEQPAGAVAASSTAPATEAGAALLPLGATIGSAGLGVMPYKLTFRGSFFRVADFIEGVDSLVKTKNDAVGVSGRLVTVDGFALNADSRKGFPYLAATFTVTTYVTPPPQPAVAGAPAASPTTPTDPSASGSTPVSSTPATP